MTLWLRVRRLKATVATILLIVLAILLVGDLPLPLPNLLGGPQIGLRLALLLPLGIVIVVAWSLSSGEPALEVVASRSIERYDTAYGLSAALSMFVVCAAVWIVTGNDLVLAAGRNVFGYLGLMFIARRYLGAEAAAALPSGYAILAALFGYRTPTQPRCWAWPLAGAYAPLPWVVSIGLLLLGIVIALKRSDIIIASR